MDAPKNLVGSQNFDILIVDDTPENIRFLSTMLVEQGYQVRKALTGKMALTAAQATVPDLILLDITMPQMDGYETCKLLKQNESTASVPVIFLSALNDVVDKVKAFQVGGVDFISKPFQFEEVLMRIQTHLQIQVLQLQLHLKNTQLEKSLDSLKQLQTQLLRKEKLSGLGQLVAGVCHEINNPVSFIAGNLKPANESIQLLIQLITAYQKEYPEPSPGIQALLEEAELDFLVADLQNIMRSMRTGVDRISSIVLALRIFSRLGESDIKSTNIHECIDSTLLLLHHRFAEKPTMPDIEIIKNYGDLPLITCHSSEMNQVFLNLLTNAIDALHQKSTHFNAVHETPTIQITTELKSPKQVVIRIKDNGIGISSSVEKHLFEPFFTTKPVGQGVGLGLATSYQIVVERHKGNLSYSADEGTTEFIIEIPTTLSDSLSSEE
ncbi:response regulator [Phormidium sp. CLA17]|uniref:hybrid sensor histidine kinase/response regulator n=1 Tax=Leptolyngbya sp. Cla-17 TaxID=2803751 RepID=UPI0014926784|nr:response regulator [Leptolyngbya sp. Cla-17]MBM0740851.1 response regulator [Leptolyngbya sp. Cla-17]